MIPQKSLTWLVSSKVNPCFRLKLFLMYKWHSWSNLNNYWRNLGRYLITLRVEDAAKQLLNIEQWKRSVGEFWDFRESKESKVLQGLFLYNMEQTEDELGSCDEHASFKTLVSWEYLNGSMGWTEKGTINPANNSSCPQDLCLCL